MIDQITDRHFRANPAFRLVVYNRLSDQEQSRLQELAEDKDFYGVLTHGSLTKAVDPETALLFLTLQEPCTLPTYVRHAFGHRLNEAIAQLVLDDILQVESKGGFVSGAAANQLLFGSSVSDSSPAHPLAQLSQNAVRYASKLPPMAHDEVVMRLYQFNTLPCTRQWRKLLSEPKDVEDWLGIMTESNSSRREMAWLSTSWQRVSNGSPTGWLSWQNRHVDPKELPYKLYISPKPQQLPERFRAIVETLAAQNVANFKIGQDAQGILRPDKMVAYLGSFEHLAATAQALQPILSECPAQGVPFTAPIDPHGLLSWGMDPPSSAQVFNGGQQESWRYWLAQQLATALKSVRGIDESSAKEQDSANSTMPGWQYAIQHMALKGIDTERWVLEQTIWQN